jgi:hypothetical protein
MRRRESDAFPLSPRLGPSSRFRRLTTAHAELTADSDEAAGLKRDDCAQGFLVMPPPCNEIITPGAPRMSVD